MATATNGVIISFGIANADWPSAPTHASIWLGGAYRGATPITTPPAAIPANTRVVAQAGQLIFLLPEGEMAAAFAADALRGGIRTTSEVRLHSGSPGASGTDNPITGNGYRSALVPVTSLVFN